MWALCDDELLNFQGHVMIQFSELKLRNTGITQPVTSAVPRSTRTGEIADASDQFSSYGTPHLDRYVYTITVRVAVDKLMREIFIIISYKLHTEMILVQNLSFLR